MANRSVTVSVGGDVGDFAASMDQAAETYKEFEAVLKRGKATFDATRTPAEKYQAKIASLSDELKRGAISQDTFNRAVKQAGDSMSGSPFGKGAGQLDEFGRAAANALPSAGGLGNVLGSLGPAGIAAAAGIGTVVAAGSKSVDVFSSIVSATGAAMDRIDEFAKTADRLGITTQSLAGLALAADLAGVGTEEFASDLERMSKNLGKAALNGGELAKPFEQLGLNVQKLNSQGADQTFLDIADAISEITSPAEQAALAQEIFGKTGQKLINTLRGGSASFREAQRDADLFGLSVSRVDAAKVEEANDNISRLKSIAAGAANTLATEFAPAIAEITGEIVQLVRDFGGVKNAVGDFVQFGKQEIGAFVEAIKLVHPELVLLAKGFSAAMGSTDEGRAKTQELDKQVAAMQERHKEFSKPQPDLGIDAAIGAIGGVSKALDDASKNADKLNDALGKLGKDASQSGLSEAEKKIEDLKALGASAAQIEQAQNDLDTIASAKAADEATKKAQAAEQRLKEMLDRAIKEGETAGMTDNQKKLFDLGQAGASPEQLDQAKQALEAADAAKEAAKQQQKQAQEADKLAQSADKLKESLYDPAQKYNQTVGDANALLNEGLIDAVTHQKALAKAAADYQKQMQSAAGATGAMEKGSKEAFSFIENARRKAQAANQPLPLGPNLNMLPPPGGLPNATGPAPGGLGGKPQPNLSELNPPGRSMGGAPQPSLEELAKRVSEGSGPSIGGKPQPTLEELAKRVAGASGPSMGGAPQPSLEELSKLASGGASTKEAAAAAARAAVENAKLASADAMGKVPTEAEQRDRTKVFPPLPPSPFWPGNELNPIAEKTPLVDLPGIQSDVANAKAAAAEKAAKLAAAKAKMQPAEIPAPIAARPPQMPDIKLPDGSGVDIKETPAMANANNTSQRGTREESDTKKIVENTGKTSTEIANANKTLTKLLEKLATPEVVSIV